MDKPVPKYCLEIRDKCVDVVSYLCKQDWPVRGSGGRSYYLDCEPQWFLESDIKNYKRQYMKNFTNDGEFALIIKKSITYEAQE